MLAAVLATTWVWPALMATDVVTFEGAVLLPLGLGADLAAVYAVAAYTRPTLGWLGVVTTAASNASATAVLLVVEITAESGGDLSEGALGAVVALVIGVPLGVLSASGFWGAGLYQQKRRTRVLAGEYHAVAAATAWALESARVERVRVAEGLRDAVLHRTAAVGGAARGGDIDAVLVQARAALAAMRGLLSGLRDDPGSATTPQPTAAGIGALCGRRSVGYRVTGAPRVLPADVDVSAYRVVELLLTGAGGPAAVQLDYAAAGLHITVTGNTPDADGATAAGLRARVDAVNGTIVVDPSGTVDVHLPAPAPAPTEEVTPFRSV
jgi:hypothetical protein